MTMEVEGRAKLYHGAMTAAYLFIRGERATVYAPLPVEAYKEEGLLLPLLFFLAL